MEKKSVFWMFFRYILLIILALPGLYLFYGLFTPLTIYPVYWLLSLFYDVGLNSPERTFSIGLFTIKIIPACIAGSAYYLLLILNLTTPLKFGVRLKSLAFLVFSFLIFNILRLIIFSLLLVEGFDYFDIAHKTAWYFGSTLFVVILWFANALIFNIKSIPAYTDLMQIYLEIKNKKR